MADHTLIVGRHPVREVLEREPEQVERVYVQRGSRGMGGLRRAARDAGIPVQDVPLQRIHNIAKNLLHQGVVALRTPHRYHTLEKMLTKAAPNLDSVRDKKPLLLVFDRIEDPHNFGAIVRTALAAGVAGAIVPSKRMAPLSASMIKASAGTATRLPIARVENLAATLEELKERGYWILGATATEGTSVWDADWDLPIALVMGAEGKGLHPRLAACCDRLVSIPMPGDVESLNVSVAAGILLFAAARSRSGRTTV